MRFERMYSAWQADALTRLSYRDYMELPTRFERVNPDYKSGVLPLQLQERILEKQFLLSTQKLRHLLSFRASWI